MRWLTGSLSAATWDAAAVLGLGLGVVGLVLVPVVVRQLK
ncbi:iron ABC transporter permease, partial [Glutamicibacter creatinolyticus]